MNEGDKGIRGASLEGSGLSVSLHPQAWVRIAKLGGLPTWRLNRENGVFLEARKLKGEAHDFYVRWALRKGWLQRTKAYRVVWFDDELGGEVQSLYPTQAEALREAEGRIEAVTRVDAFAGTALLEERVGSRVSLLTAQDLALTVFCEQVLSVDGVWWSDVLDPGALSAPRGVIFKTRLPLWRVERACP